jgi:hypothetical protein
MKAEKPAAGILKSSDFGDSKFYKVVCNCGQSDHDIDFEVEASSSGINVSTFVTVKTDYWSEFWPKRYDINNSLLQEIDWFVKDIVNGFIIRVRLSWMIWTRGYIKSESVLAMDEQQALNYAETLKSAIKDVKTFKSSNSYEK